MQKWYIICDYLIFSRHQTDDLGAILQQPSSPHKLGLWVRVVYKVNGLMISVRKVRRVGIKAAQVW
jgi:hypothetical protein